MTKREIRAFIAKLERARGAVERGDTGCSTWPDRCWACALSKHGNGDGTRFWRYDGPMADWSGERPKSDTLAMFDNSIAALLATL